MTAAVVGVSLGVVLAASALNLALGGFWAAELLALVLLRRRVRFAAGLVLALTLSAAALGIRLGWLTPPEPASYAADEVDWLLDRFRVSGAPARAPAESRESGGGHPGAALRARLAQRRWEELRYTAADVERRAGAAVTLSRSLGPLRGRAPGEIAALDDAVRRLALILTSPEFRDLEGRRARLAAWLTDLDGRLATARDEAEVEAVARALDPAAMAPVSLRALFEDLARVDGATTALVRALTGGSLSVTVTSAIHYDQTRDEIVAEARYALGVTPPLRIVGLNVAALRKEPGGSGRVEALMYRAAGAEWQGVGGRDDIPLAAGSPRVVLLDRRTPAAATTAVRSALRRIPFHRTVVRRDGGVPRELLATVSLGSVGSAEALLPVELPPPRLERITAPRHALFYVSLPGAITAEEGHDLWVSGNPAAAVDTPGEFAIETVPATVLFRNRAFARLRGYLYQPNLATTLILTGLAALTSVLSGRRRPTGPPAPA